MANVLHSVQSRLKHRKVLGVGESADGKIPRSKISQILGNDYMNHVVIEEADFPLGLRIFQWLTCLYFCSIGLLSAFYPQKLYHPATSLDFDYRMLMRQLSDDVQSKHNDAISISKEFVQDEKLDLRLQAGLKNLEHLGEGMEFATQLYGIACFALAVLFVTVAYINKDNRRAIRIALFVEAIYFLLEIIVHAEATNIWNFTYLCMMVARTTVVCLCVVYYRKTHPSSDNTSKR